MSYQTIVKERKKLEQAGLWPPKPEEKYLTIEGREYMTLPQFRKLYAEVTEQLVKEGSTTLEKLVAQGSLMPDGSVPPDDPGHEDWLFPLAPE